VTFRPFLAEGLAFSRISLMHYCLAYNSHNKNKVILSGLVALAPDTYSELAAVGTLADSEVVLGSGR
jgi:hypothetical protein